MKMQAMYNANQSNPKSRIPTAGHTNPPEIYVQQNAISQQINAIVKGNANFKIADPPTLVVAEQHNGYFDVSWTAPENTGGTPITGYTIVAYNCDSGLKKTFSSNGNGTGPYRIFTSKDDTPSTVQVDVPYEGSGTYTFNVATVNVVGTSDYTPSLPECQTAYMDPDAPVLTKAVAGFDGTADLSWTSPPLFGGLFKTVPGWTYRIRVTPVGGLANTTRTVQSSDSEIDYTVTGLTNGTSYTFAVRLENTAAPVEDAISPYSNTVSGGIPGAPRKPTNLDGASGSNEKVSLTWIASDTPGDSPIQNYKILARNVTQGGDLPEVTTGSGTTYDFEGLTNGEAYDFKVRAVNRNGTSPYSTTAGYYTPFTVPGALPDVPTATFATDYSTVTFTWNPPTVNGGNPVSDYHLKVYKVASPSDVLIYDQGAITNEPSYNSAFPTTVTLSPSAIGIPLDSVIYVKVAAVNLAGDGPLATSLEYGPPTSTPEALRATQFASDNSSATLEWESASTNGGIPITDYRIQVYRDDDTLLYNLPAVSDDPGFNPSNPRTITLMRSNGGWQTGDVIYFKVAAKNPAGDGPFSSSGRYGPPTSAPTSLVATEFAVDYSSVTLEWGTASSNGGILVIDYRIQVYRSDDILLYNLPNVSEYPGFNPSNPRTITLMQSNGGWQTGDVIYFKVAAKNPAGDGPFFSSDQYGPPNVPTDLTVDTAEPIDGTVTLTFVGPTDIGNISPITGYVVLPRAVGGSDRPTQSFAGTTAVVTGLTNGTAYTFKVAAKNPAGQGAYSSSSASQTPYTYPNPPTGVTGSGGDLSASVSWTDGSNNGSEITSYKIVATDDGDLLNPLAPQTASSSPATISGLTNGHSYTFKVLATNARGDSSYSAPSSSTSIGYPKQYSFAFYSDQGSDGSLTIYWAKPSPLGPPATSFSLKINDKTNQTTTSQTVTPIDRDNRISTDITGLTNGRRYTFQLTAINAAGSSPISNESNEYTPAGVPLSVGAPTIVWGTQTTGPLGARSFTVSWTANPNDVNTSGYTIYCFNPPNGGYSTTGSVNSRSANSINGTFDAVAAANNPSWIKLFGPGRSAGGGTLPPIPYDFTVVPFNSAYVPGSGTTNDNGGAHWYTA